nr:DnaJ domain, zinc finger, CCHC-type, tetratricopeptide-like helical domain protein [Tanacetum cinerariifolium]
MEKNDGSLSKPDSRAPSVLLKMITEHVDQIDMILMALRSGGCVANGLSAKISSKTPELESLLLHYTNHAVKRVSIKKTRKALDDCKMATYLDHGFLKVCLIAGKLRRPMEIKVAVILRLFLVHREATSTLMKV